MPFKPARSRVDAAHDLETLLGVVNVETAPPTRSGRRARSADRAIAIVLGRSGAGRKLARRR